MDMVYGVVIIAFVALIAIIGVFSDTKNRPGFKWFLIFLVLLGAGAGGAKVNYDREAAEKAQKKLDDAVALAKSSNKLAEDEIRSHEVDVENFAKQRDRLEEDYRLTRKGAIMLLGQISAMMEQFDEMEKAIVSAKKPDIAETGLKARVDASKNVVSIAKDAQWLDPPDIAKLEAWFKEDRPLKTKHFTTIQNTLKNKPMATEE